MERHSIEEFLSLPVNQAETWQGGFIGLSDLFDMPSDDASDEMGVIFWRCKPSEVVHARPMIPEADSSFNQFVDTMIELSEAHTSPCRPAQIDCNDRQMANELKQQLDGSGTVVQYRTQLDEWNFMLEELADQLQAMAPPPLPSLREVGCSDQQIREFASAAAEFYRAKLWELLDNTDLIAIESPKPPRYMKHAVILGAGGQNYGLGLYEDAEDHHALMAQEVNPQALNLFSFLYENPTDVSSDDVGLWKELDLPLETGEAFPDASLYTPKGPRRPTPRETAFLTIVLKGLAETTEDELDSGRWVKSIQVAGRRKNCKFSIPNLLDPPDREEWMRRGKLADPRGHEFHFREVQEFINTVGENMNIDELNEAINAQFAGRSLDEIEMPRNTPGECAEALYQDALESFGRRRVMLAREALAEDPDHVEAGILVAEATASADRRLELFQRAKQAAAEALGKDMEELAGQFWGFHETRPYMRACHGLAFAYIEVGQHNDAAEQFREMLALNPNDNQGVRYQIVPLLMELDRDVEAREILDRYPEESAQWLYARAIADFRQVGRTPAAKRSLRAAFKANDHVLKLLMSDEPPLMPETYAWGSPEEAAVCIQELSGVWDETKGYLEWMYQEYLSWERDRAKRQRERKRKQKKNSKRKRRK